MTTRDDNRRPIIIKRKKVIVAGAHHGGAWKVAYADFVTAMMAFFMLLWLLNSTTDQQRKGIADYFSPTIALSRVSGGGDGALGGDSMTADSAYVKMGRGGVTASETADSRPDDDNLQELADAILGKGGESLLDQEALRHVAVRLTDQGLVIELFDLPGSSLFDGNEPSPLLRRLLAFVGGELRKRPNALAVEAFTAAEPVIMRAPSTWEVSSDRAHTVRRTLPSVGVSDARVIRVTGHADRMPVARDPISARNNRVAIIVLRDRVPPRP